jgi:hypothetical protein
MLPIDDADGSRLADALEIFRPGGIRGPDEVDGDMPILAIWPVRLWVMSIGDDGGMAVGLVSGIAPRWLCGAPGKDVK